MAVPGLSLTLATKTRFFLWVVIFEGLLDPTPDYVHWREVNFRRTVFDGTLTREVIEANIAEILASLAEETAVA